jgi:hypothetical protein
MTACELANFAKTIRKRALRNAGAASARTSSLRYPSILRGLDECRA